MNYLADYLSFIVPYTIIAPIISGILCFIFSNNSYVTRILTISTSIFLFALFACFCFYIRKTESIFFYNIGNYEPLIGIRLKIDSFSSLCCLMISFCHMINMILQNNKLKSKAKNFDASKTAFKNVYISSLIGLLITDDMFNMYVFLEVASIIGYILTINKWNKSSYFASFDYLIVGSIASTFILLGIGFSYAQFGTLNMSEIFRLNNINGNSFYDLSTYGSVFCIIGFLIKSGIMPFHHWYLQIFKASTPSSLSVLSYGLSSVAILMIVKMVYFVFGSAFFYSNLSYLSEIMTLVGFFSILYGSFKGMVCQEISEFLAYSSISQCGYLLIGFLSDNHIIFIGSMMYLMANMISKILILRVYQKMLYNAQTNFILIKDIVNFDIRGVKIFSIISLISIAGLPLTIGFVAKIYLMIGLVSEGRVGAFIVIILSSIFGVIYIFRIIDKFLLTMISQATKKDLNKDETIQREYSSGTMKIHFSVSERICFFISTLFLLTSPFIPAFNFYLRFSADYVLNFGYNVF